MRNLLKYCCLWLLLLLSVTLVKADEIQSIPSSYQGKWHSDDSAIIVAVIRGGSVSFIDEDRKKKHCRAKKIEKYTTGFFSKNEVVRVTCEKSNLKEVRFLNMLFGTTYKLSDTIWILYLSKEDDFAMDIDDCLKPFKPCSRPVGFFYKG